MGNPLLELQIKLMRREAERRMLDSADLSQRAYRQSDSAYLLELLAFEILLKALILIHDIEPGNSHRYAELYGMLPSDVRHRIEERAAWAHRTGDYSDLGKVLKRLGDNFIQMRYPYEKYRHMSEAEFVERGERWLERGAKLEEADYVYYSVELNGLTQALTAEVDAWLKELGAHESSA